MKLRMQSTPSMARVNAILLHRANVFRLVVTGLFTRDAVALHGSKPNGLLHGSWRAPENHPERSLPNNVLSLLLYLPYVLLTCWFRQIGPDKGLKDSWVEIGHAVVPWIPFNVAAIAVGEFVRGVPFQLSL